MHNIWLIARREYLERIRAKSFLIMTVLIPLLMGGLLYGGVLVNGGSHANLHIALLTTDTHFAGDLQAELRSGGHPAAMVDAVTPGPGARDTLDAELKAKTIEGYLVETPAPDAASRPSFVWVPKSAADFLTKLSLTEAIRAVLTRETLGRNGMNAAQVDTMMRPIVLEDAARQDHRSSTAFYSAYAMFFLMYFVILFYGMNVARSIIEEKTSRVFEVLLSTIKPSEMMAGKVLGVGAVGLSQVGIWIVAAGLFLKFGTLAAGVSVPITPGLVVAFVVFFVLGYILYSSLAAALGAMTNSEQELQQLNMFLMLPLIACSVVIFRVVTDSDGLLAQAFSLFPFCTPLIMYVRLAVGHPPLWQVALSVFDLLLTIAVVMWFASRIYRVGILMYGKKPNLPEIVRWLKYS